MERRLAAVLSADMAGYSRLMELDEEYVLRRQKLHRREAIDTEISARGGRIVKTTGDGILAEFGAAQDAVKCAIDIQTAMHDREREVAADRRISYRVGINLGDIVFDDGDVFGDGVNVAARLQGLAEPGGLCVSDAVYQIVADRVGQPFRDMGSQRVKNISRPIRVWQWTPTSEPGAERAEQPQVKQRIRYVTSADGTQIAWADIGRGPAVLKAPNWMNHLEYEWRSPVMGPLLERLAGATRLVRFDQRGNGLSDWDAKEFSEESMVEDMRAVAEAARLDRFALFGLSQGAAFAIRYAVAWPRNVSCLVLLGGYARGRQRRPDREQKSLYENLLAMIRDGWGSTNPVFRHFFTSSFIPDAPPQAQAMFDELQRVSTNAQVALRLFAMNSEVDVTELAKRVTVPTLIFHCVGDRVSPLEEGRRLARSISNSDIVELPGNNHILMEGTEAFDRFFEEAIAFIRKHATA